MESNHAVGTDLERWQHGTKFSYPKITHTMSGDDDGDVVFDDQGLLKYVTLPRFIDLLTRLTLDPQRFTDVSVLLFTHRLFIPSPPELLLSLFDYYVRSSHTTIIVSPPTDEQQKIQLAKLLRISNILKQWVSKCWIDFCEYPEMITMASDWIATYVQQPDRLRLSLLKTIEGKQQQQYMQKEDHNGEFSSSSSSSCVLPPPAPSCVYGPSGTDGWHDIPASELARQITLYEMTLYRRIPHYEFLFYSSATMEKKLSLCPVLHEFVRWGESLCRHMVFDIVTCAGDVPCQIYMLERYIDLAEELFRQGNFNGMSRVVDALTYPTVQACKDAWAGLSEQRLSSFARHKELFSPNRSYIFIRQEQRQREPPCVPYLSIFFLDMTFVLEGQVDIMLPKPGMINFIKYRRIYQILQDILYYQERPYNFGAMKSIQDILESI
eukprot:TRINITY_DN17910_c0_g1_i2.p1 TRINITY_DN17910_c0_g1~~TRINITY_DN17910_c0_g1_i2.p1  ORF type:complete len:437 (-),score=75.81 TRINITY_DN17910_c0_g1_i2:135-1445(-)